MRRLVFSIISAVVIVMSAAVANAKEITASIWLPDTHPLTKVGYVEWANTVNKKSGGEIKVNVFTGSSLLPPAGHLTGVRDGVAQLGYHAGTYTPSDMPEDNVIAMLGIGMTNSLVTALATTDFFINDTEMQSLYKRNGIVYLGGYSTPSYILICNKEVKSLADMEGVKVRMPGSVHSSWAKSVGAVPVSVPSSEMFTGLEKGQLDCAANAANDLKNRSLWDVAKYVTTVDLGRYSAGWQYGMNADSWAGLSPKERRLLLDTFAESIVKTTNAYDAAAAQGLSEAPGQGVNIITPDEDLRTAISDFATITAPAEAIEQGKDKLGVDDPQGLINRFRKSVEKWNGLLAGIDPSDEAALIEIVQNEVYGSVDETKYGL